jgi:hypothetical protein
MNRPLPMPGPRFPTPKPRFDLFVICPGNSCRLKTAPIRLLVPLPLPKDVMRGLWPSRERPLYLACPACHEVSVYGQAFFGDFVEQENRAWLSISFRCGWEGCTVPAEFHVLLDRKANAVKQDELRHLLNRGHWKGVLPCGHPVTTAGDKKVVFEWVAGRMQGYDAADPRWEKL